MKALRPRRLQIMLYLLLLLAAVAGMVALQHCSHRKPAAASTAGRPGGDTLFIAVTYSPTGYYMLGDTIGGLSRDLLMKMARERGLEIRLEPVVSLRDALRRLDEGDFDMVASLPVNSSTSSRFLLTDSVFIDRHVLIQHDSELPVESVLQLAGKKLNIEEDSPARLRLENIASEIGESLDITAHSDLSEEYLAMKVGSGEMKYAVISEQVAKAMKPRLPHLIISTPVGFSIMQAWALRRNNTALLKTVNSWLHSQYGTAAYDSLLNRYIR